MEILHKSGVNPEGNPFVKVTVTGGTGSQLSPQKARLFGLAFLEAAEHDAMVFTWLREQTDMEVAGAAAVIGELRSFRGQIRDRWEG